MGHCVPPSDGCIIEPVIADCNCLKCMMYCLKHASYTGECLNAEQQLQCEASRNHTSAAECDVDCNSASKLTAAFTLPLVAIAVVSQW
mmetsp:Transcript_384/g.1160  ORF Transcript_384/g.1160 Transcript_384/m.1160 type:complete len:88 (-) Transcript_384:127-390(-)